MRFASNVDFESERARHGPFFAREDVIVEILRILNGQKPMARGWLTLLGGPGVGKSAILVHLLESLEGLEPREGPIAFHFIRRGDNGQDRTEAVERSLCAQIEQLFPEYFDVALPAEVRLTDLLNQLSRRVLGPSNQRLLLVIDGLDELALNSPEENPLARFLPESLPKGVVILCATRPKPPHSHWLAQRDGVRSIDLDGPRWSESNEETCRIFWEGQRDELSPPLDSSFIEEAVKRSAGNPLYATRLRDWLIDQPLDRRVAVNIPRGLDGFLEQIWADLLALDELRRDVVIKGLGLACAAREALPASLVGTILGWTSKLDVQEFLRVARPFLLEQDAPWHNHARAYRLYHESLREFIITNLSGKTMREHHAQLSKTLAAWPPDDGSAPQRIYALRHAVTHRIDAGDIQGARLLCIDVAYLEMKCSELGVAAVERDLDAINHVLSGDEAFELSAVRAALSAEARNLREDPTSLPLRLYNRLRCAGWPSTRIESVLRLPAKLPPLRLRHRVRMGATQLRSFLDHEKDVVACAVRPGGRQVLSASVDHLLRLWSLEHGECDKVLRGHKGEVTSCAITRDATTAISTSTDATTRLWNLETGSALGVIPHDGQSSTACALILEDKLFVIGFEDGTLRAWNRRTLKLVETLYGHTAYVTACATTPDGQRLVTASRDETVRVWDPTTFECIHVLQREDGPDATSSRGNEGSRWFTALSVSMDGKSVYAASGDGHVTQWLLATGKLIKSHLVADKRIDACTLTRDGHLLCGLVDGTLLILSLPEMKSIDRLQAHTGSISACTMTLDGQRVITASQDRTLKLWELSALGIAPQEAHAARITACAVTPDEKTAVSASEDGTLKAWDAETGRRRVNLEGHEAPVTACALSTNGLRVASGARDGNLRIWHVTSGVSLESVQGHTAQVTSCAILPGDLLLTASHDRQIKLWRVTDLDLVRTLGEHDDAVECCSVRADGAYALSVSRDGTAKLWNLTTYACEWTLNRPGSGLLFGALTPDGKLAVLGREDGAIDIYAIESRQPQQTIRVAEGRALACSISPDGRRLIVVFEDQTLRVLSLVTYEPISKLQGKGCFRCLATTDALLCAGDEDGNLWMIESGFEKPSVDSGPTSPEKSTKPLETSKKAEGKSAGARTKASALGSTDVPVPRGRPPTAHIGPLSSFFARLYPTIQDARIVLTSVGLDESRIDLNGTASNFWHSIVTQATKQGRLNALAQHIKQDYPENQELDELLRRLKLLQQ